jgi:hypothetical protein
MWMRSAVFWDITQCCVVIVYQRFENRVLRRIFGPKRYEATEEWRRLYNEELNDLYSSPNIIRVIKS